MTVKIEYFTDVLCVWAYLAQIRMDELKAEFTDEVDIEYRFVPIFGAAKSAIEKNWKEQGGAAGYNSKLQSMAKDWPHITLSRDLWTSVAPESSTSPHLYLKAIEMLTTDEHSGREPIENTTRENVAWEDAIWTFRKAFFSDARDISNRQVQDDIALSLGLSVKDIHSLIDNGKAYAALESDRLEAEAYKVPGSPTLVLNDGRQMLYGNVGYRIIEANVRELLANPDQGEAAWC
jgi:predicted DsbA family dithiol-disulfide isomerase